ncbi:MAG: DUF2917 domain-containing protein [Caldimonas sp.]
MQAGTAVHLGERPGELTVLGGFIWLTLVGDENDYFLRPGQRVLLDRAHGGVVESATNGQGSTWCWRSRGGSVVDDAQNCRLGSVEIVALASRT